MAFTMYSYFNSTTGDLVISGQEETLEGYIRLRTPSTNPTSSSGWPWNSRNDEIKTAHIGTISPIDVTSTAGMFYRCESLASLDLSSFDTSQVTDMSDMFADCSSLTSLDLLSFDTSHVTSMANMLDNCHNLISLDLSNFNTSQVTNMASMFSSCSKLTSLDLSSFDTSKVTDMAYMFSYCSSLTSLDLSNFDTSKVAGMDYMFQRCSSLTSLNLSSFDTGNAKYAPSIFYFCSSLHIIDIPTTATNIVSELPLENYYDAATGTQYDKAGIPGGSTYVDDLSYTTSASGLMQTRKALNECSKSLNRRISAMRDLGEFEPEDSDRMYMVSSESDSESVDGRTVRKPCILAIVGSEPVRLAFAQ